MEFSFPRDTINDISQHLRTIYKPYAGAQFRFAFLGESAEQFLTGSVIFREQQPVPRAPETYRQGDRKFLFLEHWCADQGQAVTLLSKLLSGQAEIEGHHIKAIFSRAEFSQRTYPTGRNLWTGYELRSRRDRDENWREIYVPQGDLVRRGASPYKGPDHAINDRIFDQDTFNLVGADLPNKDSIITIFPDTRVRVLSADWQPQQKKLYLEVELKVPPDQLELQILHVESKNSSQSVALKSGHIEVEIPGDAYSLSIYLLDHSDNTICHIELDGYHNRFGKADAFPGRPSRGRTVVGEADIAFGESNHAGLEEGFLRLSSTDDDDRYFMEMAVEEARKSTAEDNRSHPKVGAVVVKDGQVLTTAHRGEFPGCHAEYIALEKKLQDQSIAGSTVYTTLEPCTSRNHPKIPCATRLIERKVARVVIGMLDPNPTISGRGQRALRKASIATDLFPSDLMEQIEELNREFTRHQENQQQPSAPVARDVDRFVALEELAGQLVEELSSYRPLDREFLAPLFEEFRRAPGKFVRYPEVRKAALDLQNTLDRMFAARRDHEDGQPELRDELDAALKGLLDACDQARETVGEHPKISDQGKSYDIPLWKAIEFVSSKLHEPKDGNFFPKSRAYIRQQSLNGTLQLWGRRQLELPGPFKETRIFNNVLTPILKGYWAISQLSAACTVSREDAARIPFTLPEQSGSWPQEANAYSDIYANWRQVQSLFAGNQNLRDAGPAITGPKVRPVSYGVQNDRGSKVGLIIANDGEPAYDISIPDIKIGQFRMQIILHFTRLSKEEGPKFCEVSIQNPPGTLFGGEALADVMRLQDAGRITFSIRFRDSDAQWYVTTCTLELEATMINGIGNLYIAARFIGQELESPNTDQIKQLTTMNPPKVFISHAHEDKERFVDNFASLLRQRGIDAWYDNWEIGPGDSIVKKIFDEGLRNAEVVIVIVSVVSGEKPWVRKELSISVIKQIQERVRLIPVIIDDCPIPEALLDILHVRIKDLNNYKIELDRIVDAIFGIIQKPPIASAPKYIQSAPLPVPGLRPSDQHVLKIACDLMIAKDVDFLPSDDITAKAEILGLSKEQIRESIQILGEEGLFLVSGAISTYAVALRIAPQAFEIYCKSEFSDYKAIVRSVAAEILNRGKNNSLQIAASLEKPRLLINHIMDGFVARGYCKKSGQIGTHISVYDISPKFRRAFEEGGE